MNLFKKTLVMTFSALVAGSAIGESAFTEAQRTEIESIAASYLAEHPEVVVKALQKLQADQEKEQLKKIAEVGEYFRSAAGTPASGDEDAEHYLIDIYDYNCGYCKDMEPFIKKLAADKSFSLRVVHVNVPVISEASAMSATIAQALFNLYPEKFSAFHDKIMIDRINPNNLDELKKAAEDAGCDWKAILKELESRRPQQKVSADLRRVRELGLNGTPYLIIDGRGYPGAVRSFEELKQRFEKPLD